MLDHAPVIPNNFHQLKIPHESPIKKNSSRFNILLDDTFTSMKVDSDLPPDEF